MAEQGEPNELASELERLAGLHREGKLTDAEFSRAKARTLGAADRQQLGDPGLVERAGAKLRSGAIPVVEVVAAAIVLLLAAAAYLFTTSRDDAGDGGEVTRTDLVAWLQETEMVGPYDKREAECIADKMYEDGLTAHEAQEFLDENEEPEALDVYTDAAFECTIEALAE